MANLQFLKGTSLYFTFDNVPFNEGSFYLVVDNGLLYIDYINTNTNEQVRSVVNNIKYEELKEYADSQIAKLVNSAPETLDTLGELAQAFNENQEVVDVLNSAITTKASVDYVETSGKKIITISSSTYTLEPNRFYYFGTVDSLNITFGAEISGITNEFAFEFTTGNFINQNNFVFPSSIKWVVSPTIEANKTYQVSVLRNIGVIVGV